tara:strand:- start:1152 stop:1361 length:210 start_codon:yes stop_codon:yes gene_type:complete
MKKRGYEEQLQFNLYKPRDATPEEFDEWQEKELQPWGDRQLLIVFIMALVQLSALGFMLLTFFVIGKGL